MKRMFWIFALSGVSVVSLSVTASAQTYGSARVMRKPIPTARPSVSPYINLIQFEQAGDESLPVYQTLVRPFVDQRRLNQYQANQVFQLQQQVARNATRARSGEQLRETGHITTYQNHSHFFPTMSPQR